MATATRRRVVHNPATPKKRRKLSPAQIKAGFGGKRRRAALTRKPARKAAARKVAPRKAATHRKAPRRPSVRRNPGEIVSFVLAPAVNPAGRGKEKKKAMATTTRRKPATGRRPARRTSTRRTQTPTRRRRNPPRRGAAGYFSQALYIIAGAVGSKLITQAVLGARNSGVVGYVGNGVSTMGLGLLVGKLMKNQQAGNAVIAGGVVQIVLRLLSDFTPFGQYTSALGLGDYQISNWVTPQRYVDARNSAEVEIPAGWAPKVIQAPPPNGGMAAYGNELYTGGGLYTA